MSHKQVLYVQKMVSAMKELGKDRKMELEGLEATESISEEVA